MQAWMCEVCGSLYDPAEGNLETNISPPVCNGAIRQVKKFESQL